VKPAKNCNEHVKAKTAGVVPVPNQSAKRCKRTNKEKKNKSNKRSGPGREVEWAHETKHLEKAKNSKKLGPLGPGGRNPQELRGGAKTVSEEGVPGTNA